MKDDNADKGGGLPDDFIPAATVWAKKTIYHYVLNKLVQAVKFQQITGGNDEDCRAISGTPDERVAAATFCSPMEAIPAVISRLQKMLELFMCMQRSPNKK